MFSHIEFPRALGRSKALVTRMEFNMAEARLDLVGSTECSLSDSKCGRQGMITWKFEISSAIRVGYSSNESRFAST